MTQAMEIERIICVASAKGGVGKSTTAVNLAVALAADGLRVGLMDADIYGPSLPLMLGIAPGTRPEIRDADEQSAKGAQHSKATPASGNIATDAAPKQQRSKKVMLPVSAHGIVCNSMALLADARTAMVWRAPMIVSAFNQILADTRWGALDCLVVDMPPGTGDIQLSLAQNAELAGAVIVTTPQDVALLDARRGIEMFAKLKVPLLGLVENMSTHICSQCGHEEAVFGHGGGDRLAAEYGAEVIGRLPLDILIRSRTDGGQPVVVSAPDSPAATAYRALAANVRRRLSEVAGKKAGKNAGKKASK